jgi:hypothetical protein
MLGLSHLGQSYMDLDGSPMFLRTPGPLKPGRTRSASNLLNTSRVRKHLSVRVKWRDVLDCFGMPQNAACSCDSDV